jgi:hypothetical protein
MKRALLEVGALALLLTAIDQLYRWLHPEVDLVRATLVGLTALVSLAALARLRVIRIRVLRGALAIFASAFVSVLAIEAGLLVSRSPVSAAVHVVLLALAYLALEAWSRRRQPRPAAAALRSFGLRDRVSRPLTGVSPCSRSPSSSAASAATPSTGSWRMRW